MSLLGLLLYIVICAVVVYVLKWGADYIGLPEPFNKVARVVIVVVVVVLVLNILFVLGGRPLIDIPRL